MRTADAYLPVFVHDVSVDQIMIAGQLRHPVRAYVDQGVVRVIAGPTHCHLVIDIQRPYFRPRNPQLLEDRA